MKKILVFILVLVLLAGLVSAYHTSYNYRVYGSGYDVRVSGYNPGYYVAGFGVDFPSNSYYVGRISPSYDYTYYYPYYGYRYNPYLTDSYTYPGYMRNSGMMMYGYMGY